MKHIPLSEPLRQMATKHFVLLESQNRKRKIDTLQLNLSGYSDVMHLTADIVKVCMLALETEISSNRITEPNINISGVLAIILDLIPYEEAEFLDELREAVLKPVLIEEFIKENLFLTVPAELRVQVN